MLELGINEATSRAIKMLSDENLRSIIFDVTGGPEIKTAADRDLWIQLQNYGLNLSPEGLDLPVYLNGVSDELFRLHSASFIRLMLRYSGVDRHQMVAKASDAPEYSPGLPDMVLYPMTPDMTAEGMAVANMGFYNIATQLVGLAATTGTEFGRITDNRNLVGFRSATIIADRYGVPVDSPDQLADRFVAVFSPGETSAASILQKNERFGRCPAHAKAGYDFVNRVYSAYADELSTDHARSRFIQRVRAY